MKFALEIPETGNEAMQQRDDLCLVLERVSDKVYEGYTSGRVIDANGNDVGKWSVEGAGQKW